MFKTKDGMVTISVTEGAGKIPNTRESVEQCNVGDVYYVCVEHLDMICGSVERIGEMNFVLKYGHEAVFCSHILR